jgi:tetratricopeptide (TPR) repeat protein
MIPLLALGLVLAAPSAPAAEEKPLPPSIVARGLLKQGKYVRALALLRPAYDSDPADPTSQLLFGYALAGRGRCDEALPLLMPNLALPDFSAPLAGLIANCMERAGELGEAIYFMEQAVALARDPVGFQASLAWLYYQAGELEPAEALQAEAREAEPENDYVLRTELMIGLAEADFPRMDDALAGMTNSIPDQRYYPYRHYYHGLAAYNLGDLAAAEAALETAGKHLVNHTASRALWAEVLRQQGLLEEARDALETDRGGLPEAATAAVLAPFRARIAVDSGDLEAAEALIDLALEANPLSKEAAASAWYLARARGDDEAMAAWAARYMLLEDSAFLSLERLLPPERGG